MRVPKLWLAVVILYSLLTACVWCPAIAQEAPPANEAPKPPETPASPPVVTPEASKSPEAPKIAAVEVAGNQAITIDTILAVVKSKAGEPYAADAVDKDVTAISDLGWFLTVEADTADSPEGTRITFRVVENPKITEIRFQGSTMFPVEKLRKAISSKPGEIENNNTIRAQDIPAIHKLYHDAGYTFAQVVWVETVEGGVLQFSIMEGTIEDVRVTGNRKTKSYVILRELWSKRGDIYNGGRIRRDLQRLQNLELFDDVSAKPEVGTEPGKVIVVFNVKEKKTGLASLGAGYSNVQKVVGFVDIVETNLKGTGQRVSVRVEAGGTKAGELGYYNPWIAPHRTGLAVAVYSRRTLKEVFTSEGAGTDYNESRKGGYLTLSRPVSSNSTAYLTARADEVKPESADEGTPPDVLAQLGPSARIRSLGLVLTNDTRDLIANPSRGGMNSVSAEVAGFGGARFKKYGIDLRRYVGIGRQRRLVFATRLLGGLEVGDPPYFEQYLLGGGESLRGYPLYRFPGRRMVLSSNEVRFPLGNKLIGVVFVDAGDAWGGPSAETLGDPTFKLHVGYGVGVRVVTPIGPLRLDYGIGSEGPQTHFSIGHVF